jgi:5-methyltetrahydrofolate--homocysteine methyltransferase
MDAGAHGLDLCTALTERPDEKELMRRLIKTLAPTVRIPLVIDTTEIDVLEPALKTAPGRCLINSTHLEGGEEKARRILGIAKRYNAAVICLTIDEQGMAKSAVRKLAVARRIHDIAVNDLGLRPQDLVFDALTFTLATGDAEFTESATETLEGIRLIKTHLPGVFTSLGVSNVSFGLAASAREVINSVMLYHAVQAGLDMAIVNPAQVMPYAEIPAEARSLVEDLIFHRHPEALARVISHFSTTTSAAARPEATQAILQSMQPEERLVWRILHRHKEGVEADIDSLVLPYPPAERSDAAVRVLNSILLPAMKDVGDRFGAGELILPFVLQSAEVMKKAVAHLETYLERQAGVTKGTMVLATVYGDVHDIGKNLVKTILSNNGYTVIDLGKQVPAETIIAKAVEVNADAIGLSALLVSTSRQMPLIVNELHRRGLKFPVLIGGAAINRRFGRRILKTESGDWYPGGVFYCKDAFEALGVMDELSKPEVKTALLTRNQQEADAEAANTRTEDSPATLPARSNIQPAQTIPTPTKWGVRIVRSMPLDSVFQLLSINELYRLSWGAKNTHGSEWDQLKAEYDARLTHMRRQAIAEGWLSPQGVYGIFPAQSDGDDLVVFNPDTLASGKPVEIARFAFPRQPDGERLCLADYFASRDSGRMDTVAFQVVTVGNDATRRFDALQAAGDYTEGYFVHGLAVQTAEATAEYLHRHIRRELGLAEDQGKRYSWGYPAIPDLADHAQVFKLLPAESELGMRLTSAFQLVPEQSTAAIILHHPDARYFHIGETRIEQLTKSGG